MSRLIGACTCHMLTSEPRQLPMMMPLEISYALLLLCTCMAIIFWHLMIAVQDSVGGDDGKKEDQGSRSGDSPKSEGEHPTGEQPSSPATPSKHLYRRQVWTKMERMGLALFPVPCKFRIPHFKGCSDAVQRLAELDVFERAKVVKIGLDKAMEPIRIHVIEKRKELLVGCPGLRETSFLHVCPPVSPTKSSNRLAATRLGICHLGATPTFPDVAADLVVVGSVAVDKTGRRIGKGEGFSDLEFALLLRLGGILEGAPIVTVIHDEQLFEKLPDELFASHDVPADWIITPTQVIEVKPRREHPKFDWSLLTMRRIEEIPLIKELYDKETEDGKQIAVKEEEEEEQRRGGRRFSPRLHFASGPRSGRFFGPRRRRVSAPPPAGPRREPPQREAPPAQRGWRGMRQKRFSRDMQRPQQQPQQQHDDASSSPPATRQSYRQQRSASCIKPRYKVEFSLRVNGLKSGIRVRDLKAALMERGVRPRDISWISNKGVAFLHFTRDRSDPAQDDSDAHAERILESLKNLTIRAHYNDSEAPLKVEQAKPVRRVDFDGSATPQVATPTPAITAAS